MAAVLGVVFSTAFSGHARALVRWVIGLTLPRCLVSYGLVVLGHFFLAGFFAASRFTE